jgi:signal transduction histidine kinase
MRIRNRLTLWYAGILLVSLAMMAGVLYYEWVEQQRRHEQNKAPAPAWVEVAEVICFYGAPTALLLLVGGWLLLRKSLAPIAALTQAAERIHLDHLKERLPCSGNGDELDRLTEVFNAMTARLEDSFARAREFTLHASHELKTPLTLMQGALETTLRDDNCTPAQRELFANQIDEIQRLAKIVDGLAFLAKADAGKVTIVHQPVRLDELVRESFADAQVLAQPGCLNVQLTACDELLVLGDRHRLRQLLLNLTENAIKYNRPQGTLAIALRRNGQAAELEIANSGPGIPPGLLPRVFDRFFRGDPSHNRDVDGCGLGLAIAQWIVHAHGGSIAITSEPDVLTDVTVRFPL